MNEYHDPSMHKPNSYLAWSIVLLFFCWPFAIPALVNAISMNSLWASGRFDEAMRAAENSKRWCFVACVVGVAFWIIYIIGVIIFTTYVINQT